MANTKQVDVLMAVYNGEKYIGQQIESIMGQTYKHIHLWIRDNASEDGTTGIIEEMINRHQGRISLLRSPQNVGIIGNFGALMENSCADYVMLADADDVWLPQKVECTLAKLLELEKMHGAETPLLVHTDLKVVNEELQTLHPSFWKYSKLNPSVPHTLSRQLLQNQITGCTTMVNRPLLSLALPIPPEVVMHDWWLGICAAAFGKKNIVNAPTMLYRQHGKNDTGAVKGGVLSYIKQRLDKKAHQKKMALHQKVKRQAELFLERFKDKLKPEQREVVAKFIEFHDASLLRKIGLMIKYGFYRVGLVRNLLMIFGSSEFVKLFRQVR